MGLKIFKRFWWILKLVLIIRGERIFSCKTCLAIIQTVICSLVNEPNALPNRISPVRLQIARIHKRCKTKRFKNQKRLLMQVPFWMIMNIYHVSYGYIFKSKFLFQVVILMKAILFLWMTMLQKHMVKNSSSQSIVMDFEKHIQNIKDLQSAFKMSTL